MLKRLVTVGLPLAALATVVACATSVTNNPPANELKCGDGTRQFNGECRPSCSATAPCVAGTCVTVDATGGVCVGGNVACAYLGSDTKCVGTGKYTVHVPRSNQELDVPYASFPPGADSTGLTDYDDPYFLASEGYAYQGESGGCEGDAKWVDVPAAGAVACSAIHEIVRCRRQGTQCALVDGTTKERYSP